MQADLFTTPDPHQETFARPGQPMKLEIKLENLYREERKNLLRKLWYMNPNNEDNEDVLQGAYIRAMRALHQYDESKASLKTWFKTIMISELWDQKRKRKRENSFVFEDIHDSPVEDPNSLDVSDQVERLIEARVANVEHRRVLVGRLVYGMTFDDITKLYGLPAASARKIVQRFRESLE